jgi:hypothetical protein
LQRPDREELTTEFHLELIDDHSTVTIMSNIQSIKALEVLDSRGKAVPFRVLGRHLTQTAACLELDFPRLTSSNYAGK